MALNSKMRLLSLSEAAKQENWQACKVTYGAALLKLATERPEVVALDADLANSTQSSRIRDAKDESISRRFFDVGISEQDLVGTGAGMALAGKIPYVNSFGVFLSGRAWGQIRVSVCYPNLPVRFGGSYGGITVGPDGPTHFAISDIAILRSLPNMTLVSATDAAQVPKIIEATVDYPGPVYIRMGRVPLPVVTTAETPFETGHAYVYREGGGELVLYTTGHSVYDTLAAAEVLAAEDGIDPWVVNVNTIKPLDVETIATVAKQVKRGCVVEEHNIYGGLGGAIAEALAGSHPLPLGFIGVEDEFCESGEPIELLRHYKLDAPGIVERVRGYLAKAGN